MRTLLAGIVLLVVLGLGSLVYNNAIKHPTQPIACPMDAKVCPDGSAVARVGVACEFPPCPPPNIALGSANLAFALPAGFVEEPVADPSILASYRTTDAAEPPSGEIVLRQYSIDASSTPLGVIQTTAIGNPSGLPVSATAYTSALIGSRRFTIVSIERFEGVVDTAYYLARGSDVLRFDAVDRGVNNWTNSALDTASLPAAAALRQLLATLQGAS